MPLTVPHAARQAKRKLQMVEEAKLKKFMDGNDAEALRAAIAAAKAVGTDVSPLGPPINIRAAEIRLEHLDDPGKAQREMMSFFNKGVEALKAK